MVTNVMCLLWTWWVSWRIIPTNHTIWFVQISKSVYERKIEILWSINTSTALLILKINVIWLEDLYNACEYYRFFHDDAISCIGFFLLLNCSCPLIQKEKITIPQCLLPTQEKFSPQNVTSMCSISDNVLSDIDDLTSSSVKDLHSTSEDSGTLV